MTDYARNAPKGNAPQARMPGSLRENFYRNFQNGKRLYLGETPVGRIWETPDGDRLFLKRVVKDRHFYRRYQAWCISVAVLGELQGKVDAIVLFEDTSCRLFYAPLGLFNQKSFTVESEPGDPQRGLHLSLWRVYGEG